MQPVEFYTERQTTLLAQLKALQQKKSAFGWLRFGSIVLLIAAGYLLWSLGWPYVTAAALLLAVVFTRLVFADLANKAAIAHTQHLININADELKVLDHHYQHLSEGISFTQKEHPYANDLDIFGRASLYQYISRCTSEQGNMTLARWLLAPAEVPVILERQAAVKELSTMPEWSQELQALGREQKIQLHTEKRLATWLEEKDRFITFRHWQWLRYLLPAIILTICVLTIFSVVSMNVFYASLFVFASIAYQINKEVAPLHNQLSKIVEEVDVLSDSIALVEKTDFKSARLLALQHQFKDGSIISSKELGQLKRILDRLDMRYNIAASAPLNLLLLWNLHQVLDLEKWKHRNAAHIQQWFSSIGELEALNSFAITAFNNPNWCYPGFVDDYFFIDGKDIGHPLIPASKRVNNPVQIDSKKELMIVTGSNMAGKSTYLRSVGINTVLAMAGAPVCAASFTLSPVQLISSMRIADNLEESTSTFYAELKKLKTIIDRVNKGEKLFILLDEILRGTNSLDRHTGAVALVKQLIKQQAVCIIATHDVELAAMKEQFPDNILNYHFDVQVDQEELFFDYQLKPGICTSLNASILMKKIGIEL